MRTVKLAIRPLSSFGTPLRGDTLFGHLCWAIARSRGTARIRELLNGYTAGQPFAVMSDPFPAGYLPRPLLPSALAGIPNADATLRKAEKRKQWVSVDQLHAPVAQWQYAEVSWQVGETRQHNSIDRRTGTTGDADFAPYEEERVRYTGGLVGGQLLDLYVMFDESRLDLAELEALLAGIGAIGYGKEASTGAGRFEVSGSETAIHQTVDAPNALLTLAPSAPQGGDWDAARCWYKPLIRFGRHGDAAALSGQPFKNPLLLADVAAVLTPRVWQAAPFVGHGLGGNGELSQHMPATVHQGYAQVVPIALERA